MAPAISDILRREEARIQTTFQATTTTIATATPPSHTSPAQTTSPTSPTTPTPTPIDASNGIGGTPGNIESPSSAGTTTVLIIVILCCASAIMSATLFYIFDRKKNAQFREACKRDPYLTRKEFARRRKLSALERLEEEELQRSIMIRKSLASRAASPPPPPPPPDDEYGYAGAPAGQAADEGASGGVTPWATNIWGGGQSPPSTLSHYNPLHVTRSPHERSSSAFAATKSREIVASTFFQSNFATVVYESFEPRDTGTIAPYHLQPLFATSNVSDAFTGRIGRLANKAFLSLVSSPPSPAKSSFATSVKGHFIWASPSAFVILPLNAHPVHQENADQHRPLRRSFIERSSRRPKNTAKLHSPLFVQLHTDLLWTAQTSQPTEETYQAVVNKRKELRRRRKELRRRRKVFDEINNIYTAKPYKPKMLGPNGAATDENAEGFKDDLNCVVMCPDCKEYPPNLVEEFSSGDMVCGSCGLVVGDKIIDTRSEWRTFANDDQGNDDPSRVGDAVNPLLNGSQLETTIAFGDGRDSKQLARLQNKSQNDKASKSLMQAYKEIGAFCDSINLGKNVSDAAKHIFKLTYDHNFMKGKPQEAVIAGCIFIACRQTGVGRTFREIFQVTHVSKKEIGRVFKQLESFLQKIKEENPRGAGSLSNLDGYKASASTSAEDLCTRFCSNLNFRNAQKIENVSRALARKTSSVSELAGRSPLSVAAACIYMASHLMKESRTSKEIASVAGVSDGTIKTAYRFLYQARDRLIEKEWGADKKAIDNKISGRPFNCLGTAHPQGEAGEMISIKVEAEDFGEDVKRLTTKQE
ncbi:transcription initiation protein [Colletotrichum scovillei]|uniref:Transcription initiation factor IIB n=1 Tax=Colletotrichum scovillei TaxID=1209932 RepID=A0A9P7UCD7_9PEZI|nr:transcription initiation protein [Colletotrichum scovillei]KAG7068962.1 transcription initiation protein [Colletotrichum scovillei]KAG7072931.1 transcription initiation protein [Colletotrichum scovillei]